MKDYSSILIANLFENRKIIGEFLLDILLLLLEVLKILIIVY